MNAPILREEEVIVVELNISDQLEKVVEKKTPASIW
ncbi:MAG: hypothetical protein PWQ67_1419 [Clostridia bacterium]|jgi:hypothetical protein|nr:hypothetical protein [Clostridia bacterium]MDN5322965.1 hypothetical protein [Clostridia bacterium]